MRYVPKHGDVSKLQKWEITYSSAKLFYTGIKLITFISLLVHDDTATQK
jgi:hypothetical protein